MKRLLCAVSLALAVLLGGCSYNQSGIDGLLKPPKLSDEQEAIYQALTRSLTGKNIRLKYPREGAYISAFVLHDMDGETGDEAVVFYESAPASGFHLNLLDQEPDGGWVSKYDLVGPSGAGEIERVTFLTAGETIYLVAGVTLGGTSEKSLVFYSYQNGQLRQKLRINCASYAVFDLNDDGVEEIVTVMGLRSLGDGRKAVLAECRQLTPAGGSRMIGEAVEMDPSVLSYSKLLPGKLSDGRAALYLDGEREGDQLSTEILGFENGKLRNFIYDPDPGWSLVAETIRDAGVESTDLDGDGIVDIPLRRPAPNYEDLEKRQQRYLTEWYIYDYDSVELRRRRTTYVSNQLGYVFTLPAQWVGGVTIDVDATDGELTVYEYDDWNLTGERLLSIAMARIGMDQVLYDEGYELLFDNGQNLYFYKIYENTSGPFLAPEEVVQNFRLL